MGSTARRAAPYGQQQGSSANLADILERVLDKGVVIAGDIQINLLDIELLTIKLRLLVVSVDKAKEMGIDWWEHDPSLSSRARTSPREEVRGGTEDSGGADALAQENAELRKEIERLRSAGELPAGETSGSGAADSGAADSGRSGSGKAARRSGGEAGTERGAEDDRPRKRER